MPWKRRGERQERGKKGIYVYTKSTGLAPSCLRVLFLWDNTRCFCMLVHIMRMHMHMTHTSARAQTRMHPGTRGPDHARTHAPAHEHACMRTHTYKHTHTCMHAHAHALRTHAGTCMHATAQCTCMHTYAHARTHLHMRTHSCKHTPTYFGCALTDWSHTPQLWVVFRKTFSLFGCLALSVLHSHGHASGGNAGGWGWVASLAAVSGNDGAVWGLLLGVPRHA